MVQNSADVMDLLPNKHSDGPTSNRRRINAGPTLARCVVHARVYGTLIRLT